MGCFVRRSVFMWRWNNLPSIKFRAYGHSRKFQPLPIAIRRKGSQDDIGKQPNVQAKGIGGASYYDITGGRFDFRKYVEFTHGEILKGFQLRYVYFLDKKSRAKLTVPEIPFSRIDEMGAGMYKGEKISQAERHAIKTPKD